MPLESHLSNIQRRSGPQSFPPAPLLPLCSTPESQLCSPRADWGACCSTSQLLFSCLHTSAQAGLWSWKPSLRESLLLNFRACSDTSCFRQPPQLQTMCHLHSLKKQFVLAPVIRIYFEIKAVTNTYCLPHARYCANCCMLFDLSENLMT